MSDIRAMLSSDRMDWETPPELFAWISEKYGPFDLDAAATAENALCATYFTPEDDGLAQSWEGCGSVWLNPPYGNTRPLFPLAGLERAKKLVMMLAELKGFGENPIRLHDSFGISVEILERSLGLLSFGDQVGQDGSEDRGAILSVNYPLPGDALIELSRILNGHFSHSELARQSFHSRLMNHLDLEIESIDRGALLGLALGAGHSLVDAYAAFSVNESSAPRHLQFIHRVIVPAMRDYIDWVTHYRVPGIGKWVKKAADEFFSGNVNKVVMLIPARTDTAYWHDHIQNIASVEFIRGRVKFLRGGKPRGTAPFPSAIVVYER